MSEKAQEMYPHLNSSDWIWDSDLLPKTTAAYNIGSPTKYVDKIYTRTIQSITAIDVQGMILLQSGTVTTFPDGGTTPVVANNILFSTLNTAPTNITNFTLGTGGQVIIIQFNDAITTLIHSATIQLSGAGNKTFTNGNMCVLMNIANVWYQIGGVI